MNFTQDPAFQWLAQYAYQPHVVYLMVFAMMMASGFGFPLPEEVTIMSVGFIAFMGAHPELFPPPFQGAPVVNAYEAAAFTTFAVLFADTFVFFLGRIFGRRIIKWSFFKQIFNDKVNERIQKFTKKYGTYATFIFRFTPGIRFPAHIFLGMSNMPLWKFVTVDGVAALISVPTQVLLIYFYGQDILSLIYRFKIVLAILALFILGFLALKKIYSLLMLAGDKAR
jgi:membrane protein DedA with SNARE-associated domain